MHKEVTFTKEQLLDILDGKVIVKRDIDGIMHRFMIDKSTRATKCFKVYYDLLSKRNSTVITNLSQIVQAISVEEAVEEIKKKYDGQTLSIAVNKISERRM
ncbi:hypothetical protein CW686_06415 [Macrococcoides caseolyticum]|uniref:Uncharacterized protein n=2 Tax=Macrococcoides caseolyticum TaxID=69966 RepID=A0A855H347_9STAP|nr:hypothetical protein CW686_06415 [Macrococcus caseolyticus]PKE58651.1 hypothetical protein CW673_06535 [Macrococcus caseolyticus]